MRLTLRTMLAYMDGILKPDDAEEISKKIEESQYATSLLHRTRDVMRRLRLAAPSIADRGSGLDANTVAEYLDNTLSDSRVPDFEKVCLESDVHLAEIASCHQILTLVLGEAAEIDSDARQRMYRLPQLAAAQPELTSDPAETKAASDDGESGGESVTPKPRRKPTIPDYLREPRKRRRLLPTVAALVLLGCLVGLVLASMGQFERESRLMCLLLGSLEEEEVASGPEPPPSERPSEPIPSDPDSQAKQLPGSSPQPAKGVDLLPEAPMPPEQGGPPAGPPPGSGGPELPVEPAPGPTAGPTPESTPEPTPLPTPEPTPLPTSVPQRIGRLMSDHQVLLRYDSDSDAWQRVPPQGFLVSEERLVALSGFRPKITLGAGVLQLLGSTCIDLLPSDEQNPAGVRVHYGRALIMPLAEAGTPLRLRVGDRTGLIIFEDAESIVALEVRRVRVPGTDPEVVPAATATTLLATSGRIVWDQGPDHPRMAVDAGTCLVIDPQGVHVPVKVGELPKWVTEAPLGDLDRRATTKLEQALRMDRPPNLVLTELADPDHRQEEVRRLAARCLGDTGEFGSLVAALNNADHRLDWPEYYIEYLQAAIARDTEVARKVREAMEKEYPQDSAAFYRMFWGYTTKDLEAGEDAKLVEYLDHKTLAFRVLSFWNLKGITGYGLNYRPEQTAAKRQAAQRNWRRRLEAGEIRVKLPSEGVEEKNGPSADGNRPPDEVPLPP